MITLAFDSCSKTASVAVLQNTHVLYETILNKGLHHSEVLLPAIDEAFRLTNLLVTDIDFFACTLGPGSFTGLRIGLSTLKGFMLATEKPAAGVSSLAALALNVKEKERNICAMMDAGRGQVYYASYQYDQNGLLQELEIAKAVNPRLIAESASPNVVYVGDGAIKYADLFPSSLRQNIAPAYQQFLCASSVGLLALENYRQGNFLSPETCVPFYLRSTDVT